MTFLNEAGYKKIVLFIIAIFISIFVVGVCDYQEAYAGSNLKQVSQYGPGTGDGAYGYTASGKKVTTKTHYVGVDINKVVSKSKWKKLGGAKSGKFYYGEKLELKRSVKVYVTSDYKKKHKHTYHYSKTGKYKTVNGKQKKLHWYYWKTYKTTVTVEDCGYLNGCGQYHNGEWCPRTFDLNRAAAKDLHISLSQGVGLVRYRVIS